MPGRNLSRRLKRVGFETAKKRISSIGSRSGSVLQSLTLLFSFIAAIAAIAQAYFAHISRFDAFEEIRVARRVEECAKLVSSLRTYKRELQLLDKEAIIISGLQNPQLSRAMNQYLSRAVSTVDEIVESTTRLQMIVSVENVANLESAIDTMKGYLSQVTHFGTKTPRTPTNFESYDRDAATVTGICRGFAAVFSGDTQ